MPNGKSGDHPYTDIVIHGTDVYDDANVSKIVKHIDEIGDVGATNRTREILWNAGRDPRKFELTRITNQLYTLAAELRLADDYPQDTPLEACLEDNNTVYSDEIRALVRSIDEEMDEGKKDAWPRRPELSAILWEFGWEIDRLDESKSRLCEYRDEKIREQ